MEKTCSIMVSKGKSQTLAGRGDFEKKKRKKCKNVTCRGVFEQRK